MMEAHQRTLLAVVGIVFLGAILTVGAIGLVGATTHEDVTCEFPFEVEDATGETVVIDEEPETVVTLAPSAAQTMWEIGARDKVIGVSMHAGFLEGAGDRTNVSADPMSIDIETVVDLEPDLVLAPNVTPREEVDELRRLGLTVYHAEVSTDIEDVKTKTVLFGQLVGACDGAAASVDDMEQRLDAIEAQLEEVDTHQTVYYPSGGGFTPGAGTFQTMALEQAGLTNIAVEANIQGWDIISEEVVIEQDPDWIVYPDSFAEPPVGEGARQTTAWQEDQVITVDAQSISQPAPRIVDAIEEIHVTVYGDIEVETPTPDDEAEPIPGFSVVAGLLAIGLLTLLAFRRRTR